MKHNVTLQTEGLLKFHFKLTQEDIDNMNENEYAQAVAQLNFAIRQQIKMNGLKLNE